MIFLCLGFSELITYPIHLFHDTPDILTFLDSKCYWALLIAAPKQQIENSTQGWVAGGWSISIKFSNFLRLHVPRPRFISPSHILTLCNLNHSNPTRQWDDASTMNLILIDPFKVRVLVVPMSRNSPANAFVPHPGDLRHCTASQTYPQLWSLEEMALCVPW